MGAELTRDAGGDHRARGEVDAELEPEARLALSLVNTAIASSRTASSSHIYTSIAECQIRYRHWTKEPCLSRLL